MSGVTQLKIGQTVVPVEEEEDDELPALVHVGPEMVLAANVTVAAA
jgi:hypothetical protein